MKGRDIEVEEKLKKGIFIAEDDAIILLDYQRIVNKIGYHVTGTAMDGEEAILGIRETHPDMVFMDINLPKINGFAVMREIQKKNNIPCLFITGYYTMDFLDQAADTGALGYLMKPVDEQQLAAAVAIAFKRADEIQTLRSETHQLRTSLEERKDIERAKGVLMDHFGLKESEAMAQLQKMSRNKNKKLAQVAREVIMSEGLLYT